MTAYVVEAQDEAVHTAGLGKAADSLVGVVVDWMALEHNKRTFAAASQAAAAVAGHDEFVDSSIAVWRRGRYYAAGPRPHRPASSLHSCACNAGGPDSLPQRFRGLQR
jgi:hypothetical protein